MADAAGGGKQADGLCSAYNSAMSESPDNPILDRLFDPLITPEAAERLTAFQPDAQTVARIECLRERANEGQLTDAEREEYAQYVELLDLVGILKAKARIVLSRRAS